MGYGDSNTFHGLRVVNARRCEAAYHPVDAWSPCEWMTAIAGEVGEAANLIKKLKRIESEGLDAPANQGLKKLADEWGGDQSAGIPEREKVEQVLTTMVGDELADVVIYIDLLAARLGIDLGAAVIAKFNRTSEKVGSPERLPY